MKYKYYGRNVSLWRLYFVESHHEFSRVFFIWMSLGQITARLGMGIFFMRPSEIQYAIGQISGLFAGLKAIHSGDGLLSLLNEA